VHNCVHIISKHPISNFSSSCSLLGLAECNECQHDILCMVCMNKRKTPTAEQARFKYAVLLHLLAGRARRRKISAAPAEVLESDFKNGTIACVFVNTSIRSHPPGRPPAAQPYTHTWIISHCRSRSSCLGPEMQAATSNRDMLPNNNGLPRRERVRKSD
jgi:hypothetical protein